MINPNEYQNYLNFESSECCEIDEFHQESLKHIVLNEDSSFYVQNEYPVKESIENEHKAQYIPRFEDRSIERFGYVCRSISPIGDVTNRFAKNLNRESQSVFLESDTAASPSFINQICTKYAIINSEQPSSENRTLNEESKILQSYPIDGECSDFDSEYADEIPGAQIEQEMQESLSESKLSDLQNRVIELKKFLDSLNFGDKEEWEICAGMKKNCKRDNKMKLIARKTTCDTEEDTFSSSLNENKYPGNQGYQGRRKGENGYEESANDAILCKISKANPSSFGKGNKSTNTLDSKLHICIICSKQFSKNGLGGHMSRAHPGESENYKRKKDTRDLRERERTLLRKAQEEYKIRYGKLNISNREIDRKYLELIKNEIRQREQY